MTQEISLEQITRSGFKMVLPTGSKLPTWNPKHHPELSLGKEVAGDIAG